MQIGLKVRLLHKAASPYLSVHLWDYLWAQGKLQDPIFSALLEQKVFSDRARILDLGCGRGLLAAWFLAAEKLANENRWTAAFSPPRDLRFRGVELIAPEAQRGNTALRAAHGDRIALAGGDMRAADMTEIDAVAILDVLHYIPHAEQDQLLDRIRAALDKGGLFVTRIGDAAAGWRFRYGQIVDRCMSSLQGHGVPPTWCRPLSEWRNILEARGFAVEALPMSKGTLFANVMLICRVV